MNREELSIWIERYLDGELTAAEKLTFEARLDTDEKFREEFELHLQLRRNLTWVIKKEEFQLKMNRYHREFSDDVPFGQGASERKISLARFVLVAASVSLLVCSAVVTIYHFSNQVIEKKKENYTTLNRTQESPSAVEEGNKEDNGDKEESMDIKPEVMATAFAITSDGYMLTNYHVVKSEKFVKVEHIEDSLKSYIANVITFNRRLDIALIKINDPGFSGFEKIPYVFSSESPSIGQKVFTLGYPKNDIVYSEGPVSSLTGYESDTIALQLGLPVNPGNSGAPVFTENGEIVSVLAGKNAAADGEAYGVKINYVLEFLSRVQDHHPELNTKNLLRNKKVTDQVKELQKFIFIIKA